MTSAVLHPTDLHGPPWLPGQPAALPPSTQRSTGETPGLLSRSHIVQLLVSGWQWRKQEHLLQGVLCGVQFNTAFESLCSLYEVLY